MNQLSYVPTRLKNLRQKKGLTVSELADLVGVSRPTIWSWESARSEPRRRSLAALAAALGVSERDVLGAELGHEAATLPVSQHQPAERLSTADSALTLADVIARAKEEIARFSGTEPSKVRIIVEI